MNDNRSIKKEQKQHIQVFVRVRPINSAEHAGRSFTVVEMPSTREVILHERPHDKFAKKFTFDRVFGPQSRQIDVYNVVVKPLVEEVLAGYNCTVFAYGQTGTGKTFTMEGVSEDPTLHWQTDTDAGIIPRTLSHMFDELSTLQIQEYIVRVSFLEIYNEELFDLLSPTDDISKIRLYEDSTRKGSVIIHGLEEVTVRTKSEVYKILKQGSEKRQTATTLMNANSSRSHTVFSITVHIKENTVHGEELLKIGKINLVDLAGSENIGRSGSSDKRAREAGNINQSLLTLGRVITALVERAPHVPYRESKLTRLLQESLGGRMKTSIIATVSPASINLEETLSTLDYAHRAKNITNRPEINQKLFKTALLQEYTEEIERLKRDLQASRERVGVYLAEENYADMQNLIQHQTQEIEDKINHIKALQKAVEIKEELFNELNMKHSEQVTDLQNTRNQLESVTTTLKSTTSRLNEVEHERIEQKHLLEKHVTTENTLLSQAHSLLDVVDVATTDVARLHDKVNRKAKVEEKNENLGRSFINDITKQIDDVKVDMSTGLQALENCDSLITHEIKAQTVSYTESINEAIEYISKTWVDTMNDEISKLESNIQDSYARYQTRIDDEVKNLTDFTDKEQKLLMGISAELVPKLRTETELMKSVIEDNLRLLNEEVSKQCSDLQQFATTALSMAREHHLANRDYIIREIEEIKCVVESLVKRKRLAREKQDVFAKMVNDALHYFNDLHTESKERYSVECNTLNDIDVVCDDVYQCVSRTYNVNIMTDESLRDRILDDVEFAKLHLSNDLQECRALVEEKSFQTKNIATELETNIESVRNNIQSYEITCASSLKDFRHEMQQDENTVKESICKLQDIVGTASGQHSQLLQHYKTESLQRLENVSKELDDNRTNAENIIGEVVTSLDVMRDEFNKFFTDDFKRDVPTGCTPKKADYQYSRQLAATSPHERILNRYRKSGKDTIFHAAMKVCR